MERVDWMDFIEKKMNRVNDEEGYKDAVKRLVEIGVLSIEPKENYQLIDSSKFFPRFHGLNLPLYFTDISDALKYVASKNNIVCADLIVRIEKEL